MLETIGNKITARQPVIPLAWATTLSDFYVDDFLTGSDSVAEALQLQHELIAMLNCEGFNFTKWCSNEAQLLEVVLRETERIQGCLLYTSRCV